MYTYIKNGKGRSILNLFKKKPKRYVLYSPDKFSDLSGDGYNMFLNMHIKSKGNVLEHLIGIGSMMTWYQIVDTQDNSKVIADHAPE
jgi:hypothetical protein